MTLAKAKAKTNETFIVQVPLMIITYDRKYMFIVQATGKGISGLENFKNTVATRSFGK
jgi:hypothetical protein